MFANSSEAQVALVAESTWGTTPTTPGFSLLRFTKESLKIEREGVASSEIRPDRNVAGHVFVSGGASGGLGFELSYGAYDAILEALLQGTWTADVLKNGVTKKFFTLEKKLELGTTDQYFRYTGMMVDTMNLAVRAKEMISGDFGFIGKGGSLTQAAVAGATYAAASTEAIMSASLDFASLSLGGATPKIQGISLDIKNNLRAVDVAGSMDRGGVGSGRFEVTGNIEAYFEDNTLYDLFLAGNAVALSMVLGSTTLKKYTLAVPSVKIDGGDVIAEGNDGDIMCNLSFRGVYNSGEGCTLKITRAVA